MEIIKPTKKEVFNELKNGGGCCWLGGKRCRCYSRQLQQCYADAEKSLTKVVKTPEEIQQNIETNKKAMEDINKLLSELFD